MTKFLFKKGSLLQKMITDSYNKIKKTLNPQNRKLYLYSGHENNVAAMLACSGVFEPHQPPYGSTYILELHHKLISNTFVFKVGIPSFSATGDNWM